MKLWGKDKTHPRREIFQSHVGEKEDPSEREKSFFRKREISFFARAQKRGRKVQHRNQGAEPYCTDCIAGPYKSTAAINSGRSVAQKSRFVLAS